ncbi:ScpA family protein [Sphingomonas sp.]|uniref:segregation and condensation protein A n=1 Tax=Sphingomonas sp. TaxID=28214 RepID=UPI0025F911C0|nr:ScpA family protein [Sphingomonas sp.]
MNDGDFLTLDLDGWEGPLNLLLALARSQKVDLHQISILALVDQYLDYLNRAGAERLDQAADYLVMAAWLAYLKSCLLLPRAEQEDPGPEELAFRLQQRLLRLDAMREAGARLLARDVVGRDVFIRPAPEGLATEQRVTWQASLYDLIAAYGLVQMRRVPVLHQIARRPVLSLEAALSRIEAMLGRIGDWTAIAAFVPKQDDPDLQRSALASTVVATLELARRGVIDLRQQAPFAPLMICAA